MPIPSLLPPQVGNGVKATLCGREGLPIVNSLHRDVSKCKRLCDTGGARGPECLLRSRPIGPRGLMSLTRSPKTSLVALIESTAEKITGILDHGEHALPSIALDE